ncbi:MAG: efflux transporter, family, subunit [Bryobacterales bacterium]|nr:efflux transporter, family, subunit [Bryobacterales bacterium]
MRFCLCLALLLTACGKEAAKPEAPVSSATPANAPPPGFVVLGPDAPELKQITIEAVKMIPVPGDEVSAPARVGVNPNRVGHAMLQVPGRIVKVLVKLGDSVTEGQPVMTVESPALAEAESAFLTSESGVKQAEIGVAKAEADLSRLNDLLAHEAVARKDALAAETNLKMSESLLEQSKSTREQARRRLQLLGLKPGALSQTATVFAPLSGKVLEINAVDGEVHNEVNQSLLTIADLSRVWVSSEVPESMIRNCRVGGTASLELIAYPGETFRGHVTRIADTVDKETRTIEVTSELDNSKGRLRPEMFGRMNYANASVAALWVPESAVVRISGKESVFVEVEKGRFQAVAVETGPRHNNGFPIRGGVTEGQRVVTMGAIYLKAGL